MRLRWSWVGLWAVGIWNGACASAPPPAETAHPASTATRAVPEPPWPDVAAPLPTERSGFRDAAVVIAAERYAHLPPVPGAVRSGRDWATFFRDGLGIAAERITELYDADATRSAIVSAVTRAGNTGLPGSRVWIVFIGHGREALIPTDAGNVTDKTALLAPSELTQSLPPGAAEPVMILDLNADPELAARLPKVSATGPSDPVPTIRLVGTRGATLPQSARPAFSYLALGALRGWADANRDGLVTVSEARVFIEHAMTHLTGRSRSGRPEFDVSCPFWCKERTVLSTLHEARPNLELLARGLSPPPVPDAGTLESARHAIAVADGELQAAYAIHVRDGAGHGIAERKGPTFTGEGESRRIDVVPMPDLVERAASARVHAARELGGPGVPDAAEMLLEAGQLYFSYGDTKRTWEIARPLVTAQCGASLVGYRAWELLLAQESILGHRASANELVSLDCSFDPETESLYENIRQPLGIRRLRGLEEWFERAQKEPDPDIGRCTWSRLASEYADVLTTTHGELAAEAALNGAYSWVRAEAFDEAARTYRDYVNGHAHPPTRGAQPDREHRWVVVGCRELQGLADELPRLRPAYVETCVGRPWQVPGDDRSATSPFEESSSRVDLTRFHHAEGLEELTGWLLDPTTRRTALDEALVAHRAAAMALAARARDVATKDAVGVRLALAAALVAVVRIERLSGGAADPSDLDAAVSATRAARDAAHGDRRVTAALRLVELADGAVPPGALREWPLFEAEGDARRALRESIPATLREAIQAREEFLASVEPTEDALGTRRRIAVETARRYASHGHLAEARAVLEPLLPAWCGRFPEGFVAWELLLGIASWEGNGSRTRELGSLNCATDPESALRRETAVVPQYEVPYRLAEDRAREAASTEAGPKRVAAKRVAAAAFARAVRDAPERDEAPEAALRGAALYRELGLVDRERELLREFLARYGSVEAIRALASGARPGLGRHAYQARTERTVETYDALVALERRALHHRDAFLLRREESRRTDLPATARAAARREAAELAKMRGAPPP